MLIICSATSASPSSSSSLLLKPRPPPSYSLNCHHATIPARAARDAASAAFFRNCRKWPFQSCRCTNLHKSSGGSSSDTYSSSSLSLPLQLQAQRAQNEQESSRRNSRIRRKFNPYEFDPLQLKKEKGFFTAEELQMLHVLQEFEYRHSLDDHGQLLIRLMGSQDMADTEDLLTDSFIDLMWGPLTYRPLLRLSVRDNMLDRRSFIPHAATLVGLYYAPQNEGDWVLGGTVELSFNSKGSSPRTPTPVPPKSAPYLCNMAVDKNLRRRGIGKHLLNASEKLVQQMGLKEMYLHCRIVDLAPFSMYIKSGYKVVETDNLFTLLTLQRRRHLMYKELYT